jgi:hypothetical protein
MRKAKVLVCENAKGDVIILYNGKVLDYTLYQKPVRQAEVVNSKSIDTHLKKPYKPAPDHPWRRYGKSLQKEYHHGSD